MRRTINYLDCKETGFSLRTINGEFARLKVGYVLLIVGSGAAINTESQFNGGTFYSVESETVVENIAVYNGPDDAVEFFGGTITASNVYVENLLDDAIDSEWT